MHLKYNNFRATQLRSGDMMLHAEQNSASKQFVDFYISRGTVSKIMRQHTIVT